jgi:hypothetical protein
MLIFGLMFTVMIIVYLGRSLFSGEENADTAVIRPNTADLAPA